jgi:hypothetical protein
MPLPHYTQLSNVGSPGGPGSPTTTDEVVYTNLFEITFVLPSIFSGTNYDTGANKLLLLENATKIDLSNLTSFEVAAKEQRFKYSTRQFQTTPSKTSGEITIPFQVNVNNAGQMTTWTTLKAWYDLLFNSQNGTLHYKSDMVGTIIVNQHDKKGVVLRRVTFMNCQMSKLTGWALDWASNDIVNNVDATFLYDYFVDEYIDNGFGISSPMVSGY